MTKPTNNAGYLLRLPDDTWAAVKQITAARGQPVADYLRDAVRLKLMADGAGMNSDTLTRIIEQANTPLTESANFAAVHAAATLAFLRECAYTLFQTQGLPDDLAREKADTLADTALAEAVNTFENPQNRVQFRWIERFDEESIRWLFDDDDDDADEGEEE